ncbi:MAG TPA: Mur ligase family protein [Firmicutes bacterium]|nr:Mur ligase family protein [Bacillota bacterium]
MELPRQCIISLVVYLRLVNWLRFLVALWLGKLAGFASRTLGRGGSSLPGKLCLLVDSGSLKRLSGQLKHGSVLVTGTNGKTTTSRVMEDIFRAAGRYVIHNRSGANLLGGVTSTFVDAASLFGRVEADIGLLETDEASIPRVAQEVNPAALVVTNFFRDQLDRFGELAHTVELVRSGLPSVRPGGILVLNADDPLAVSLGRAIPPHINVVYFGLDPNVCSSNEELSPSDAFVCPSCGGGLEYTHRFYSHLGIYRCLSCGFSRPQPDFRLTAMESEGMSGSTLEVVGPEVHPFTLRTALPGLYNAYNVLAGVAAAWSLGVCEEEIRYGVQNSVPSFGRMERVSVGDKWLNIALVKNPTGFNAVLETVASGDGSEGLMLCINDNYADGTDVSWLWDVNFEILAAVRGAKPIVTSGIRAADMAVRLKYAGVDPSRIKVEPDLEKALDMALSWVETGGGLVALPTYTAMLQLREVLRRRGLVRHFRED